MRALIIALLVLLPITSQGFDVVINNGDAPPNPLNVIDSSDTLPGAGSGDTVHIENEGCDNRVQYPCQSPGAPTAIEIVSGTHNFIFRAHQTSTILMTGGSVGGVHAERSGAATIVAGSSGTTTTRDSARVVKSGGESRMLLALGSSTIEMLGGTASEISVQDSATVTLTGGRITDDPVYVDGRLLAHGSLSTIYVHGDGFAVDGQTVPFGVLQAQMGTLTGLLASGDPIDNLFVHSGGTISSGTYDGEIVLVQAEAPALPLLSDWAAGLLVLGLMATTWLRASLRRREPIS